MDYLQSSWKQLTIDNKYFYLFSFLISILVFSVYSNIVYVNFSVPDDSWMLLNNKFVTTLSFNVEYFKEVFTQKNNIQYSPINTLYYAFIFKIDGYNPFWYHLGSIVLHIINTIIVVKIFKIFVRDFKIIDYISFYGIIILWSIHPLNVEAVVWISASKILLSSSFIYLCIYLVLKNKTRTLKQNILIQIFFVLACFTKEQSILLPAIILILDICYHKKKFKDLLTWEYLSYFIILCLFLWITMLFNYDSMKLVNHSFMQRLVLMFYSLFWYGINIFIPQNLHYHYPFPIKPNEAIPFQYYIYVLLFLVLIIYGVSLLKKSNIFTSDNFYLIIICLVFLAPCLHIIPMYRPAIYADRYMYQPLLFGLIYLFLKYSKTSYFNYLIMIYIIYFSVYSYDLVMNWSIININ
ncbi:hypothetical protein EDF66_105349 [Sphingobacterium sp. JUb20]|nr:hypothetical protein [Sphingobacterium sp. JUb21]TCR07716.1 hypothetical protein EDF66_105349 [Sphingobacterium sp. JUb20]